MAGAPPRGASETWARKRWVKAWEKPSGSPSNRTAWAVQAVSTFTGVSKPAGHTPTMSSSAVSR